MVLKINMCITDEEDVSRGRGLPIVVGVTQKLTDSIRVEDAVVEFVVDILDINDFRTKPLLATKISKRLYILKKTLVCNDNVICGVVCATQIGRRIYGNFRFLELVTGECDILDGGIIDILRSNLR